MLCIRIIMLKNIKAINIAMEKGIISVRIATISSPSPTESNRVYVTDLVELTEKSYSVYFLQRPGDMTKYDMINTQDLGMIHGRMNRTGARAMHLTMEESDELFNAIFGERDNEKASKLLAGLNKRIKQAGLKGEEKSEAEKRGKLFTS